MGMTTLVNEGRALVVRCDDCRRLWPILAERLEGPEWRYDAEFDRHQCPVCAEGGVDAASSRSFRSSG
jgi:predicted RNA-binding Zn-ribbon protein involved in translation (DUF1610 family)